MSYLHFLAMGSDPMEDTKVDIESPEADIKQRIIQYIRENAPSYLHFLPWGQTPWITQLSH